MPYRSVSFSATNNKYLFYSRWLRWCQCLLLCTWEFSSKRVYRMAKIWRSQSWRADRMITVKIVIYQGRRRYRRRSHQFRISLACWRAGRRNSGLEYKVNAKHGFLALFSNHYYFGLVSILLLVWFENLWNLCGRVTFSQAAVVAFFNSLAEGGMQASIMVQKLSPSLWCISNIKKKKRQACENFCYQLEWFVRCSTTWRLVFTSAKTIMLIWCCFLALREWPHRYAFTKLCVS